MFERKLLFKNQKGQAITEYVLLLVIVLAILAGVIYQFNDSFRIYTDAWFKGEDSYLGCIIKNGILPDGGSETADCTLPQFDPKSGKTLAGTQGQSGSSKDDGSSSSRGKGRGNARFNSSSRGGGKGDGRSAAGIAFNSADEKNAGLKAAEGKSGEKANTGDTGFSSRAGSIRGQDELGGAKGQEGLTYRGKRARGQEENLDEKSSQSVPLTERDMKSAREIAFEKSKRKVASKQEEGFDLSFGNVFKYIIIILLVFSIFFFVGSQVLAVSRSKKRK